MSSPLAGAITRAATKALRAAIEDPHVPVHSSRPEVAARTVAARVEEQLAPVVAHVTNTEPWYRSRVTWGAIVSAAAGIGSTLGFAVSPQDVDVLVGGLTAAGAVVGAGITLYGRWRARRPLGV